MKIRQPLKWRKTTFKKYERSSNSRKIRQIEDFDEINAVGKIIRYFREYFWNPYEWLSGERNLVKLCLPEGTRREWIWRPETPEWSLLLNKLSWYFLFSVVHDILKYSGFWMTIEPFWVWGSRVFSVSSSWLSASSNNLFSLVVVAVVVSLVNLFSYSGRTDELWATDSASRVLFSWTESWILEEE